MTGQGAAVPDAVQGAVEHRQPSLVREGLGDVRLGVPHQALELLTRRVDVGAVDRVRLPSPAVAVVGQPDGPAAGEDGGAPRRHLVEAGRFVPIDKHRPRRPASRQAHAHVAVGAGAGQPRLGAQGAVDEGDAAGAVRVGRPVRHERPVVFDRRRAASRPTPGSRLRRWRRRPRRRWCRSGLPGQWGSASASGAMGARSLDACGHTTTR